MWKFYYDEAFHDRNITVKEDLINIYKENSSDIYVGFFVDIQIQKNQRFGENIFYLRINTKKYTQLIKIRNLRLLQSERRIIKMALLRL